MLNTFNSLPSYVCLVTYTSDVQSISTEDKARVGFSSSEAPADVNEALCTLTITPCSSIFTFLVTMEEMEYSKQLAALIDPVLRWFKQFTAHESFYVCANFQVLPFQEGKKNLCRERDLFYRLLLKQQEHLLYFCCSDSLCLLALNPWVWMCLVYSPVAKTLWST